MSVVLTALIVALDAESTLDAYRGEDPDGIDGPWFGQAPEGTALPYITIQELASTNDVRTSQGQSDLEGFQIDVWAKTPEIASAGRTALKTFLNGTIGKGLELTLSDGSDALYVRVDNIPPMIQDDVDKYHSIVDVVIMHGVEDKS